MPAPFVRQTVLAIACSAVLLLGCKSGSAKDAKSSGGACRVEIWSLPWDQSFSEELDEEKLSQSPLAQRRRVRGCKYAEEITAWMKHAKMLPASAVPPGGDLRLLARVSTARGSWLLGVPQTCSFVRLDRTRVYHYDPGLFALLTRPLAAEERALIERFGACGPRS